MKVIKELQYWNKPGDRRYQILEDSDKTYFAVYNVDGLELPQRVIDYSQKQNDIIPIYECGEWILTEYLEDFQPVIIRGSCDFYEDLRVKEYNDYFKDPKNILAYYKRVIHAHQDFIADTNWYFDDRTGTNVLVNRNFTDLRIIDVCSLRPVQRTLKITFSPNEFFYPREWEKAIAHKHGLQKPDLNHLEEYDFAVSIL